jgi:hypothetical protein
MKTFSKIYDVLGHKVNLDKYKKIDMTSYILSMHSGVKLETNSKKKYKKYIHMETK